LARCDRRAPGWVPHPPWADCTTTAAVSAPTTQSARRLPARTVPPAPRRSAAWARQARRKLCPLRMAAGPARLLHQRSPAPGDTCRTSGKPLSACASRRSWAARLGTLPQNTITAATAQEQQARRRTHATTAARLAGSSSVPGVQLQSPARALAECPAQLRAGGEPDCGRGLGGQLLSARRRRADLRGDAAPREDVGTGG
jgi:hypothetical protein